MNDKLNAINLDKKMTVSTQLLHISGNDRIAWKEKAWDLMCAAYKNVAGGLHFNSPEHMLDDTHSWDVLYTENDQMLALLLYKEKHGQKIVGLGATESQNYRHDAIAKLGEHIRQKLYSAWIEVSERAESFVLRNGGENHRISNHYASQLTGKSILNFQEDGFHYVREICGIHKQKIIIGTPQIIF